MKPNKKILLSVAIATFNEQEFIGRCLDSVKNLADEIIIVDGQSTDRTVSIVDKYQNSKIISTNNKPMFHINKQLALDNCSGKWILQLDADEVVSPSLSKEIKSTIQQDHSYDGYWLKRANYFLGRFLKKGGQYPDPTLRLYKNKLASFPCKTVHEQVKLEGTSGYLNADLLHYADYSFSRYILRQNRYTTEMATQLFDQKKTPSFLLFTKYFFVFPTFWFLKTYLRHKGFLDGFPGFVFSLYSSLRYPAAYVKLYELYNREKT